MPPDFVIPHSLCPLYRCSLTTLSQGNPYHGKLLIRDCCNHKGSCTLFRPYLNIAAGISSSSFYETISSEFLVQGNFKHTQFSQEHCYWLDSNSQPRAPKASFVSIELTLLMGQTVPKIQKCGGKRFLLKTIGKTHKTKRGNSS